MTGLHVSVELSRTPVSRTSRRGLVGIPPAVQEIALRRVIARSEEFGDPLPAEVTGTLLIVVASVMENQLTPGAVVDARAQTDIGRRLIEVIREEVTQCWRVHGIHETDLPMLLDLIVSNCTVSNRVKWIVSSRNWLDIEERLKLAGQKTQLSLELNAESVSAAVKLYIQEKMGRLAETKGYGKETRDAVENHLLSNADNTFLWVALVCQNLEKIRPEKTLQLLDTFPPGLDPL